MSIIERAIGITRMLRIGVRDVLRGYSDEEVAINQAVASGMATPEQVEYFRLSEEHKLACLIGITPSFDLITGGSVHSAVRMAKELAELQ